MIDSVVMMHFDDLHWSISLKQRLKIVGNVERSLAVLTFKFIASWHDLELILNLHLLFCSEVILKIHWILLYSSRITKCLCMLVNTTGNVINTLILFLFLSKRCPVFNPPFWYYIVYMITNHWVSIILTDYFNQKRSLMNNFLPPIHIQHLFE